MSAEQVTPERVTVEVTNYAVPQLIAPNGRWNFHLRGHGFEVDRPNYTPAHSVGSAESAGRRLAKRLGFKVTKVNVETL